MKGILLKPYNLYNVQNDRLERQSVCRFAVTILPTLGNGSSLAENIVD